MSQYPIPFPSSEVLTRENMLITKPHLTKLFRPKICVPTICVAIPVYKRVSSGAPRVTNSRRMTFQCPLLRVSSVCLSTTQVAWEMTSKTSSMHCCRTLRETSV